METIISIIALSLSVISCGFACASFVMTMRRDRRQATLKAYNKLQNEVFDRINLYRPEEIATIAQDPRSEAYNEVAVLIARIEHFCVGVTERIYDRKTVYSLAHGFFDGGLRRRIEPMIARKNSRSDFDYYSNIHKMLAWMDKKSERKGW